MTKEDEKTEQASEPTPAVSPELVERLKAELGVTAAEVYQARGEAEKAWEKFKADNEHLGEAGRRALSKDLLGSASKHVSQNQFTKWQAGLVKATVRMYHPIYRRNVWTQVWVPADRLRGND